MQVTDNNSVTASKQFTLAVTSNLSILTASPLPDATAGSAYARNLSATGGVPPYVWTVKTGALPPGLALDPAEQRDCGNADGERRFRLHAAGGGCGRRSGNAGFYADGEFAARCPR